MDMATLKQIWEDIKTLDQKQREQLRRMIGYASAVGDMKNKEEAMTEHRFSGGRFCVHCNGKHIVRNGHASNGMQRYLCRDCGKTFVITTNSLLSHSRKNLAVWQKYLDCFMNGDSLRKSAKECGINLPTSFQWRHKILDALEPFMKKELSGIVEADETFYPVSYKGNHSRSHDFQMPRKSRQRGHSIHHSGLSREWVCVPCALNHDGRSFAQAAKLGKISTEALERAFENRIAPGSTLCTDYEKAYHRFSDRSGLQLIQVRRNQTVRGIYGIQRMNSYHSRLKAFTDRFRGVSTKYLNNYLRWFSFLDDRTRTADDKELLLTTLILFSGKQKRNRDLARRPALPFPAPAG